MSHDGQRRPSLAVVVPIHDEAGSIAELVGRLLPVLRDLSVSPAVILVDDGSTDGTAAVLAQLHAAHPDVVTVLRLSRNFGQQAALTAGMDWADADAVVCMDGDGQHPPELIPELVARWQEGFDVVQAVRRPAADAGLVKRWTSAGFYALLNLLSSTHVEPSGADFRLVSRRVADVFRTQIRERDRFLRGLVAWVGYPSCRVEFDARARLSGFTKYSLRRMLSLARSGFVSFSKVPLKFAVVIGMLVSLASFLYGIFAIVAFFRFGHVLPGWASTIVVVTFLGGCNLLFLGLIGEYLGTIFDETKARPLYLVTDVLGPPARPPAAPARPSA